MKQVNCGSCEYRWRTRQYLQNEKCQNVLSKRFFIPKRKLKQHEKNGMNYLKRDENKKKKNSGVRAACKVFPHWSQKEL